MCIGDEAACPMVSGQGWTRRRIAGRSPERWGHRPDAGDHVEPGTSPTRPRGSTLLAGLRSSRNGSAGHTIGARDVDYGIVSHPLLCTPVCANTIKDSYILPKDNECAPHGAGRIRTRRESSLAQLALSLPLFSARHSGDLTFVRDEFFRLVKALLRRRAHRATDHGYDPQEPNPNNRRYRRYHDALNLSHHILCICSSYYSRLQRASQPLSATFQRFFLRLKGGGLMPVQLCVSSLRPGMATLVAWGTRQRP